MQTQALPVPRELDREQQRGCVVLGIEGMVSPRSEQVIEAALSKLPGVSARANYASQSLRVEFDRTRCALPEIARRLDELGYRLRAERKWPGSVKPQAALLTQCWYRAVEHRQLTMAIVGAALLAVAFATRLLDPHSPVRYIGGIACFVTAGWYTAINTLAILRRFQFDIDVLMFAAAFGAAALGRYEEGAMLLVLFALGGAGEHYAMERARRAIEALAKFAPETAIVRDPEGREREAGGEDPGDQERGGGRRFERV